VFTGSCPCHKKPQNVLEEFEIRLFEEIKKLYERCLELLEAAPPKLGSAIRLLLQKLHQSLRSRPDLAEKAIPTFYNACQCIIEKRYADAVDKLVLLLVLMATTSEDN